MKNKDLFIIREGLQACKDYKGVKFAYAVAKNFRILNAEIEDIQEGIKPDPKWNEYEQKRQDLLQEYAKKDEDGNAKTKTEIEGGREVQLYDIDNLDEYNVKFDELAAEYKEVLEEKSVKMDEYYKMLDNDATVELHRIKQSDLPDDITGEHLDMVWELVLDEE